MSNTLDKFCACDPPFQPEMVGGAVFGGSATVTQSLIVGDSGAIFGGDAFVDSDVPLEDYEMFYPLDELGAGVSDEYEDLSPNNRHAVGGSGDANFTPDQATGVFCSNAQKFGGNDNRQWIETPSDGLSSDFTIGLWMVHRSFGEERILFSRDGTISIKLSVLNTIYVIFREMLNGEPLDHHLVQGVYPFELTSPPSDIEFAIPLNQERWYFIAVTKRLDRLKLYINGTLSGEMEIKSVPILPLHGASEEGATGGGDNDLLSASKSFIGANGIESSRFWLGEIQELRITPLVREQEWIEAEYDNFCDDDFYTADNVESSTYTAAV